MDIDIDREIDRLLAADQHDPFQVLGWQVIHRDPLTMVIRAFHPGARTVRLVVGGERLEMYRMRDAGLFEVVLNGGGVPEEYLLEVTCADGSVRLLQDPYRFPPQLSDFDRYLFGNGTHYQLYNLLGAHPASMDEALGVVFRVWAPSARRVSVLGNFNDWDGRVHQMRCLGTSGIWELFLPGVSEGEVYKFEIKTRGGVILEKPDPFQFHAEPWPKSASIVQNLNYQWQDKQWLTDRGRNCLYRQPISIYEVHAASWGRDSKDPARLPAFGELADRLIPHVKKLGFTHIELLPLMETGLNEERKAGAASYFTPGSRSGSPKDLMAFVDQCHLHGIGVIMGWPPDHHAAKGISGDGCSAHLEEEGYWRYLEAGESTCRYRNKEMANFLIASVLFWLDKYHLDGIRMEAVTTMLYRDGKSAPDASGRQGKGEHLGAIDFLRHLNQKAAERFPGVLMIADECSRFFGVTRETDGGGLGFHFKWDRAWIDDSLDYFCSEHHLRKYRHLAVTRARGDAWAERAILPLSHKQAGRGQSPLLIRMPGDHWQQFANIRLLFFSLWCQPGKKLMFMGNEIGQETEWQANLDWHLSDRPGPHLQLQEFVRALNNTYRENSALWDNEEADIQWLLRGDAENSIVVFARHGRKPEDHLVCLFNYTPEVHHGFRMGVPAPVRYREILCSDESRFGGSNVCNPHLKEPFPEPVEAAPFHVLVSVPPLGGLILKPALEQPEADRISADEKS